MHAKLWSRQGRRLDGAIPDVMAATTVLEESAVVLDCELVVLDERGHPDFAALSGRAHARTGSSLRRATDAAPAVLAAFDVLMVNGQDLRGLALERRLEHLGGLGLSEQHSPGRSAVVAVPAVVDGLQLVQATFGLQLEGVVAKRRGSVYVGRRSRDWVKVKHAHARDLQSTPARWRRAG